MSFNDNLKIKFLIKFWEKIVNNKIYIINVFFILHKRQFFTKYFFLVDLYYNYIKSNTFAIIFYIL